MSGSTFKDGYTEAERDQISELIDSIPGQYYGEHGDWEETVLNLTKIIRAKMRRRLVQRHKELSNSDAPDSCYDNNPIIDLQLWMESSS